MRKVVMSMMVSLDGFTEGPEGPDDWSWHVFDDAMEAYTNELVDSLDLMIMGRLTYQMLSRFWLAQTGDFADKFNRLSKIIYSRTLDKVDAGRSYEVESQGADDPRGTVGLLQKTAGRQRPGSVENADVIETEKTAGEQVVAFYVFAVHPPREVEKELLEGAFEKGAVASATRPGHFVNAPDGPRMHRRIHIAESELIGRNLPVRVHILLAQKQDELLFRKIQIDLRKPNHMKRQIPRREPRILPLVRHRDDVAVEKMRPLAVAAVVTLRRRWRLRGVAVEPGADDVVVKLLAPEQPRVSLAGNAARLVAHAGGRDRVVEFVGLAPALREDVVKLGKRFSGRFVFCREPKTKCPRLACFDFEQVMRRELRAGVRGIYRPSVILTFEDNGGAFWGPR